MKIIRLLFLIPCFLSTIGIQAQIGHGGSPLFPTNLLLRSTDNSFFIEMPSFDVDSLLKEDQLNQGNMRGSFRFAHKFYTDIERGKSGLNYTLPDGTKVWQTGIRSKGAYSINLLFSEFHLPEGGKLFIYNSAHSHIIGSFTDENNSENNMLPIQPVQGEEIIIEYTEPANVSFEGRLKITEVNHDYIGLRVREPNVDPGNSNCMKDVVCTIPENPNVNSTLLIIINGTGACTGTLLNNTAENGEPYVLTAAHCLNDNFNIKNPDYEYLAGTVVAFFSYQRSICGVKSKGTEEMTLAGARKACVIDTCDISLLHFNETPPDYYNPYYSGWSIEYEGSGRNISVSKYPYINIHHPSRSPKKTGHYDFPMTLSSTSFTEYKFMPYSHWLVRSWTEGATAGGSSGSPIFDSNHRLVGGLSGGKSLCSGSNSNGASDYFFALFRGWEYGNNPYNQLKTYLDPKNYGSTHLDGFDPYKKQPLTRLRNANYNATVPDTLVQTPIQSPATGYLFGHNSLETITEFAEEFQLPQKAEIVGAYFFVPRLNSSTTPPNIKVHLYNGNSGFKEVGKSIDFKPVYVSYDSLMKSFGEYNNTMNLSTSECFVKFPEEIELEGKFYVSYEISYPATDTRFSIHNTNFGSAKSNTAWMKSGSTNQWMPASQYPYQRTNTSLAIQPVVRYKEDTGIEKIDRKKENKILFDRNSRKLTVLANGNESGQVTIYTISGQIMEKFLYTGETSVVLSGKNNGAIGIVKVLSGVNIYSSKIIY